MKGLSIIALWLFTLTASSLTLAQSAFVKESFTSQAQLNISRTTLVWNSYFHIIHPPLAISYTTGANNEDSFNAAVGSGANGIFDVSTYSKFSVGGVTPGNVITIDTTVYPVLQFISFNLASGWKIRGQGANPLWIEVLGPVTIAGTIDCSGENGVNSDSITSSPTIGGLGHCSGYNGGNGGYLLNAATQGQPNAGVITGGFPATLTGGSGGGGGGGYRAAVGQPQNGSGANGGAAGTETADPKFTTFLGGGGGGGGAYNVAGYRGASGGAGGGVIRITSIGNITVTATGSVITRGGTGGGGTAPAGGGGGGGAGGGIWFQTPGTITNNGIIDAGVFSGVPDFTNEGVVTGGSDGGRGSDGRTWLTNSSMFITPMGSETPVTDLPDPGVTHYSVSSGYVAESLSYDTLNTSPTYLSFIAANTLPGTSVANIVFAASNDNFVNDNTGFLPTTSLSSFATKRYFKFQISLQEIPTGFASTPASINSVTANYNGVQQSNFAFSQTCGYLGGGPWEGFTLFLEFLFIYLAAKMITSERRNSKVPLLNPSKLRW